MSFFDRIWKKKKHQDVKPMSSYYNGEIADRTRFVYYFDEEGKGVEGYKKVTVDVLKPVDSIDGQPLSQILYECSIGYNDGKPSLRDYTTELNYFGFEKVLASFDLERMKTDTNYTKYVCCNLLNPSRIKLLHDIAFGEKTGTSCGNYVGSLVDTDKGFLVKLDLAVGTMVDQSSEMSNLRREYANRMEREKQEQQEQEQLCLERQKYADEVIEMLETDDSYYNSDEFEHGKTK